MAKLRARLKKQTMSPAEYVKTKFLDKGYSPVMNDDDTYSWVDKDGNRYNDPDEGGLSTERQHELIGRRFDNAVSNYVMNYFKTTNKTKALLPKQETGVDVKFDTTPIKHTETLPKIDPWATEEEVPLDPAVEYKIKELAALPTTATALAAKSPIHTITTEYDSEAKKYGDVAAKTGLSPREAYTHYIDMPEIDNYNTGALLHIASKLLQKHGYSKNGAETAALNYLSGGIYELKRNKAYAANQDQNIGMFTKNNDFESSTLPGYDYTEAPKYYGKNIIDILSAMIEKDHPIKLPYVPIKTGDNSILNYKEGGKLIPKAWQGTKLGTRYKVNPEKNFDYYISQTGKFVKPLIDAANIFTQNKLINRLADQKKLVPVRQHAYFQRSIDPVEGLPQEVIDNSNNQIDRIRPTVQSSDAAVNVAANLGAAFERDAARGKLTAMNAEAIQKATAAHDNAISQNDAMAQKTEEANMGEIYNKNINDVNADIWKTQQKRQLASTALSQLGANYVNRSNFAYKNYLMERRTKLNNLLNQRAAKYQEHINDPTSTTISNSIATLNDQINKLINEHPTFNQVSNAGILGTLKI